MAESPAGARAMCVWLGTLASYRPGFIGELVLRYRTTAQVLAQPPGDIAEFTRRRRRGGKRTGAQGAVSRAATEAASDAARFAAVLAEGPQSCLRRAELRPPGDVVVAWSESLYPDQLRDLGDPPLCLFVRGGADRETVRARVSAIVDAPLVAVVGTRRPSPYGMEMARGIAGGLARAGLIVVSGMALGVDAAAQKAAVDAQVALSPDTVAVLGCGSDVVYPRSNRSLYSRITRSGLVISEFAWGVPARAWRFPARNRVMAALARAVVLVEGADRSGARITAGHGVDLGREVLCVPGEAGRQLSQAPNRLLGHGASVCESAEDVLSAIGVGAVREETDATAPLSVYVLDHGGGAIRDVLQALSEASLTVDQLAGRCGITVVKAASAVSDLEIEGLARRVEGGRYRLLRP
jgi:DNA processing protein